MNLSSPRVGATKKLQWASGQGGERGLHSLTSHWRPPAELTAFRTQHDCARNQTPSASVRYRCRPGGGRPRLRLTWHRIAHREEPSVPSSNLQKNLQVARPLVKSPKEPRVLTKWKEPSSGTSPGLMWLITRSRTSWY